MRKTFAVVGGVHLDVRAEVGSADAYARREDAIGTVQYSIGGCAYNVGWNLARNTALLGPIKTKVVLHTAVARERLDGRAVLEHVQGSNIELKDLGQTDESSGYVSHVAKIGDRGSRLKAITSSAVERTVVTDATSREIVAGADLVYVDTNVSVEALRNIAKACGEAARPMVIGVASDDKAVRARELLDAVKGRSQLTTVLCLNMLEARALGLSAQSLSDPALKQFHDELGASATVVTHGEHGWAVLHGASVKVFEAPAIAGERFPTGAGDALASAVCLSLVVDGPEALAGSCRQYVDRALPIVLRAQTATPDASRHVPKARGLRAESESVFAMALASAIAILVLVVTIGDRTLGLSLGMLMLTCASAGALGAIVRAWWAKSRARAGDGREPLVIDWGQALLGSVASVVAVVLVLVAQVVWIPDLQVSEKMLESLSQKSARPLLFTFLLSFITGFSAIKFLSVLDKKTDVTDAI